jgi:hypothetical protein
LVKGERNGRGLFDVFFTASMSVISSFLLGSKLWDVNAQPKMFHRNFMKHLDIAPHDFSLDLFYEDFTQEDLMDYDVEIYMKNSDTYAPQRRYMVWKMKRSCVYDTSNNSYDISPVDTQQYDYGFNPTYDSWSIDRSNSAYGVKWVMNWSFGNYADYSISIKIKTTTKKY